MPQIKKTKSTRRRPNKNNIKRSLANIKNKLIYLVYYDIQSFSLELTHPIITFKTREAAEVYVQNRNFEFQTLMLATKNAQQTYVLDSLKTVFNDDYCITASDLNLAAEYFYEEYQRELAKAGTEEAKEELFWHALSKYINPFRITVIEHVSKNYK